MYLLLSNQHITGRDSCQKPSSPKHQLTIDKADVAELQAAGQTTSTGAYFTIQTILEHFLNLNT